MPSLCVFYPIWVCAWEWGGVSRGLGHNLLPQFFNPGSSKMELAETDFFDTLTIQNDQIAYIKHGFALLYVFFTLFGCWVFKGGPGATKGSRVQLACAFLEPRQHTN